MRDQFDLLFGFLPLSQASSTFVEWFSSTGRRALSRLTGSDSVAAFRTTKGFEGFNILARTRIDPLDTGLIEATRRTLEPVCDTPSAERTQIGLFRLAAAFAGASANEPVKVIFVIGRAAGSIPLEEFRDWYDHDHMGGLASVPGIVSAMRYEAIDDPTHFLAVYEVSDPDVMSTSAWKDVSKTAWTTRVRSRYVRWLDFTSVPLDSENKS
jgi:hypothetical protein